MLSALFRDHPDLLGETNDFISETPEGQPHGFELLRGLATGDHSQKREVREAVGRILHQPGLGDAFREGMLNTVDDNSLWMGETDSLCSAVQRMALAIGEEIEQWKSVIREYDQAGDSKSRAKALRLQRIVETIEGRPMLTVLGRWSIIPKYGFPVDTVQLNLRADASEARKVELERDLKIALYEYAPGARVVANHRVWTSYGLQVPPQQSRRALQEVRYFACQACGYYQKLAPSDDVRNCPSCQVSRSQKTGMYVLPEWGFVTSTSDHGEEPGEARPARSGFTQSYFELGAEGPPAEWRVLQVGRSSASACWFRSTRGWQHVINEGPARMGYHICAACGFSQATREGVKAPPGHHTPWGRPCGGSTPGFCALGHAFLTDVLMLRFPRPAIAEWDQGCWWSLAFAIQAGAARALKVNPDDIECTLHSPLGSGQEIVLFDSFPGGVGYVALIAEGLQEVLEEALRVVACGSCGEETCCYACLQTYRNQWHHHEMKRGPVRRFLASLLSG